MTITKQMRAFVIRRETLERRKDRWEVRKADKFVQPVPIKKIPYRLARKSVRLQRVRRFVRDKMKSINVAMRKSLKKFDALLVSLKD
jgi:hypothetical protein